MEKTDNKWNGKASDTHKKTKSGKCPGCQWVEKRSTLFQSDMVPVVNNITYGSQREAFDCRSAGVKLAQCSRCGLVYNEIFDDDLTVYDVQYNSRRDLSRAYERHLDAVAVHCRRLAGPGTTVLEIGCGQGEFLRKVCEKGGCRGVGFDGAYRGDGEETGRIRFYRETFDPVHFRGPWDVIVLRHVLEHISNPYEFFSTLTEYGAVGPGTKIMIEVPDLEWILQKGAYFDVTYEHCNYFCKDSLVRILHLTGWKVKALERVFQNQYLLASAVFTGSRVEDTSPVKDVSRSFRLLEENRRRILGELYREGKVLVWGASGKGTIFLSGLSHEDAGKVSRVVDIDARKQGRYLPVSGKRVDPPHVMTSERCEYKVIVMNPVYEDEITRMLRNMGVEASIVTTEYH